MGDLFEASRNGINVRFGPGKAASNFSFEPCSISILHISNSIHLCCLYRAMMHDCSIPYDENGGKGSCTYEPTKCPCAMGVSMPKHAAPLLMEQITLIALSHPSSVKPICEPYHNANLRSDGDDLDLIQVHSEASPSTPTILIPLHVTCFTAIASIFKSAEGH